MLRLGLALGRTRAFQAVAPLAPVVRLTPLLASPAPTRISALCAAGPQLAVVRTYAAKSTKGQTTKKPKYSNKVKVPKIRTKHGTRKKRTHWLDPQRMKKMPRRRPPKRILLSRLNTEENIKRHVEKLKAQVARGGFPQEHWVRVLLHQIRCSPENGAIITDLVLKHPKRNGKLAEKTYVQLLKFWYRRKNIERTLEVFEKAKEFGKATDPVYSLVVKSLATRGQLDKAKEVMEEREAKKDLQGSETLAIMTNYIAADNIAEGVKHFERLKAKLDKAPVSEELYSTIIGWCLRHNDLESADKYIEERKQQYLSTKYVANVAQDEADYEARLKASIERKEERRRAMEDWERRVAEAEEAGQLRRLLSQGQLKKPTLPEELPEPVRWSKDEFLARKPVTFTSHLIRPLLDLVEQKKEIPRAKIIGKGLRQNKVFKQIYGIAQILGRGKSKRLETLSELLKILKLPKNLSVVQYRQGPLPKPVSVVKKKEVVIKKWWKKPLPEKAAA